MKNLSKLLFTFLFLTNSNTWRELSPISRQVVREINRLGIMLNCSHISDDTFAQVVGLSKDPVIASHSSDCKFTSGFVHNEPDV